MIYSRNTQKKVNICISIIYAYILTISSQSTLQEWEPLFTHVLDGPISKVSKSAEGTEPLQFAVLYHVIEDQDIRHCTRVYYFASTNGVITSEYKGFMFPGSTMINAISLEQNSILYAR